ncbi:AraC family transcriptional regulator [Cohnella soli]|uniref:AraC family transcriptional regulator n=1 Tax=Cohnella soli TaxID=425005 RepID=A0ABW0HSA2_9BACL
MERERKTPERLLHEQYMLLDTPFRLFRHQVEWVVSVHWHEFFEIALVTSGAGTHIFNGKAKPLKRGSLFLLTPADFHEIVPDAGQTLHLFNAIFVQRYIRSELLQWIYQAGEGIQVELEEDRLLPIEREFERMWDESEQPVQGGEWVIAGALERVLVEVMRSQRAGRLSVGHGGNAAIHPAIVKAVTYISFQFHEPLTLASTARHVGLSANYFSECFRKETGVSFQRFLQDSRLQFAHSMLGVTQLPITEICYASGFGNLSHFERAFKSKYGRTPRQARHRGGLTSTE